MSLGGEAGLLLAPDAVQHLELVLVQLAPCAAGELLADGDQARVVGPDHRVALAVHEDLHDPDVRPVDPGLVLDGDGGGLLVGALHDPDAGAVLGQAAGVVLGAEEVRLDDAAGLREVLPELLMDGEHGVEGGVVLGVQGDGRADLGGGLDDGPDVREGQLVAVLQRLAEHRQLDGHLGALAEAQLLEAADELQVGVPGGVRLLDGGDVLADDVEGDLQAAVAQLLDDRDDVVDRLTGDEAGDDLLGPGAADTKRRILSLRDAARITGPSTGTSRRTG